jgi:hypothetical protein
VFKRRGVTLLLVGTGLPLVELNFSVNKVLHFLCPVANTVIVLPSDGYVINFSISFEVVHFCSRTLTNNQSHGEKWFLRIW